jgi:aminobenzoyl-glutamate utilization protein B
MNAIARSRTARAAMRHVLGAALGASALCGPSADATDEVSLTPAKATALEWIEHNRSGIVDVNQAIWGYAELGLQETRSARTLMDWLESNDFTIEEGVAGMPTAFVANYGSGQPIIGLLAEYDALPDLSQVAEPHREPRIVDGAGHGCGHSLYGAGSTAAAIAIRQAMAAHDLPGTVRLYGTPAEETVIGKIYMVKAGFFDDVDAVLRWHPMDVTEAMYTTSLAMASVKFDFAGVSAHAAAAPERGRSALDAVELMNVGANYLREHVKDDARIHYVITEGGGQPNVVPARAQVWYYIRAYVHADVAAYYGRLLDIARGAAMMTRTDVSVHIDSDTHELIPNRPLAELVDANLRLIGGPDFSSTEETFARMLQEGFARESNIEFDRPVLEEIRPLPQEPARTSASTDVGDLSWKVPTGGLTVASYPAGIPIHSWPVVAASGAPMGHRAMLVAAKTLAASGIDLLTRPATLEAARADLRARTAGAEFRSLLPAEQTAPESIR